MPRGDLQLLLARDGAPALTEGLDPDEAGAADPSTSLLHHPDYLWEEGDDPNLLTTQRWGVLAPQGPLGDRLLALIKPLIDHRAAQQGPSTKPGDPSVRVYRVPPRLGPADALRWRKRVFEADGGLRTELPRFLLLLGDLDTMPLSVQHAFAGDAFPGRLAFPADDDYARYVEKVLSSETANPLTRPEAVLCGVRDGTSATDLGRAALLAPGLDMLREACRNGHLDATLSELDLGERPSADPLLARAAALRSAVLFTLGHGEGPPRGGWTDPRLRRARQGALHFGREPALTGADLRDRPFMPGGVWCNLSCYGAGTPDTSAYLHWLRALADAGRFFGRPEAVLDALPKDNEPPFTAAMPQAALASSDGPLAYVGHVDLAWTYGFQDLDDRVVTRPGRLMALVRALLRGDRAGVALRELARGVGMTNAELTALFDQDAIMSNKTGLSDQPRRAHLWLLRQDLSAYVLLGDPAVRLRDPTLAKQTGPVAQAPAASPALPAGLAELARKLGKNKLEEAFADALVKEPARKVASRLGIELADLRALEDIYRAAGRKALGLE